MVALGMVAPAVVLGALVVWLMPVGWNFRAVVYLDSPQPSADGSGSDGPLVVVARGTGRYFGRTLGSVQMFYPDSTYAREFVINPQAAIRENQPWLPRKLRSRSTTRPFVQTHMAVPTVDIAQQVLDRGNIPDSARTQLDVQLRKFLVADFAGAELHHEPGIGAYTAGYATSWMLLAVVVASKPWRWVRRRSRDAELSRSSPR
jgi:hypothetical protein